MSRFVKGWRAAPGIFTLALAVATTPLAAQVVIPPDTAVAARGDSTPVAGSDTAPAGAPAPSAAAPGQAAPAAPAPQAQPMVASEPVDSALAAACAAGGGVAEGLLVVGFRAGTTPEAAAAVAKAVGARLAGPASSGGFYLELPSGAGLNAFADRVILQDRVEAVGPPECPPPPAAPPPATPPDTSRG